MFAMTCHTCGRLDVSDCRPVVTTPRRPIQPAIGEHLGAAA